MENILGEPLSPAWRPYRIFTYMAVESYKNSDKTEMNLGKIDLGVHRARRLWAPFRMADQLPYFIGYSVIDFKVRQRIRNKFLPLRNLKESIQWKI